jgi:hypothetical protein
VLLGRARRRQPVVNGAQDAERKEAAE